MNSLIDYFLLRKLKTGDLDSLNRLAPGQSAIYHLPATVVSVIRHADCLEITALQGEITAPEHARIAWPNSVKKHPHE